MPVSFPSNPQVNDTFESNNKTWQWNGTAWVLVSVPQIVGNASITEAKLATGAVTADKIGSLAVTSGKIDSNAVTAGKIASSAITETKVNDGAITQNKLASGLSGITVTTTALRSTVVPTPFTGQFVFLTDTSSLQRWDGSSWVSVITTVPTAAPTGLALVSATTNTATISFTPGADGGSAIINYEYSLSTDGGSTFGTYVALSPADASSPITITGLSHSTQYQVKLKAVNALGAGASESSALSFSTQIRLEYLVIAGGGGGGQASGIAYGGGGGGAGGYRTSVVGATSGRNSSAESLFTVTNGVSYTVTVGGGGGSATAGNNSVFDTITSTGGGRGGNGGSGSATSGGSGGGGGDTGSQAGFAGAGGTANQGFDGGSGAASGNNGGSGGGGGGAGGNGSNGAAFADVTAGGAGLANSITGSSVTRAAGGQGGAHSNGGQLTSAGGANTGTGGGGGRGQSAQVGYSGGSGVVILRYPSTASLASSTTGSPSVTTSGGYRIYTFANSGSITW